MRYEARFRNGVWTVFDTEEFYAVRAFDKQSLAEQSAERANKEAR